nr:hypothetical protein CFP56_00572 [Quercus suber]
MPPFALYLEFARAVDGIQPARQVLEVDPECLHRSQSQLIDVACSDRNPGESMYGSRDLSLGCIGGQPRRQVIYQSPCGCPSLDIRPRQELEHGVAGYLSLHNQMLGTDIRCLIVVLSSLTSQLR